MALRHGEELQQWEIAVAKKLVGEFRRRSRSLEREEFDDLLQECLTHWIEVRRKLAPDPGGPPVAYMARVVRNKLTDMLREQRATKRGGDFGTVSLDAAVGDSDDAPTYADLLDAASFSAAGESDPIDRNDARIDIARAMAQLTPRQRRLCTMLGEEGLSIKAAAARLRIPRATVYDDIKRIRKVFADHGLGDYLAR
ncbi:MAG: sigma-70 family RNA polymerase sigma factor [Burkholderiaceae bacterium]|nr:sigma-70 family RNA polymerase sigma factor [Burkholderiaceae bacterium]